jgi:uncharacterized BrkB/YihY/UPF0761 family membrane protein
MNRTESVHATTNDRVARRASLLRRVSARRRTRAPRLPRYALIVLLLLLGASGVAGGLALLADATGSAIDLPLAWLDGTPFEDYRAPGLILLVVLGLGPLAACVGVWTQRSWGWIASLAVGVALLVWIMVQIALIGYQARPPLQALYAALGVAIVILSVAPSVLASEGALRRR